MLNNNGRRRLTRDSNQATARDARIRPRSASRSSAVTTGKIVQPPLSSSGRVPVPLRQPPSAVVLPTTDSIPAPPLMLASAAECAATAYARRRQMLRDLTPI